MKNFKEKEIKDLRIVMGGLKGPDIKVSLEINFTVAWGNFFDKSILTKGSRVNEFDKNGDKPVVS